MDPCNSVPTGPKQPRSGRESVMWVLLLLLVAGEGEAKDAPGASLPRTISASPGDAAPDTPQPLKTYAHTGAVPAPHTYTDTLHKERKEKTTNCSPDKDCLRNTSTDITLLDDKKDIETVSAAAQHQETG